MSITLTRISSVDPPMRPAYVTTNLDQTHAVCELLGTADTVWSKDQIDDIGRRAAAGEFDMHSIGNHVYIHTK